MPKTTTATRGVPMSFRLTTEEEAALRRAAEQSGMTPSDFTRHAVRMCCGLPSAFTVVADVEIERKR